jgi:uncharacterized repeat protein (TIGR04076 family)
MTKYKVSAEIVNILEEGTCPAGHQIGEKFEYPDDVGKICPAAFHSIYPYIRIIQSGGYFPYFDEPNAHSACCPDYKRPVVFKISRQEISE